MNRFTRTVLKITCICVIFPCAWATSPAQNTLQNEETDSVSIFSTVTDIDGNVYRTVIIGTQEWMVDNLRTTRYNDGTPIPFVSSNPAWQSLVSPGYCWPNNNPALKTPYGAMYNWYAVMTGKLAPLGWRVPSDSDWTVLTTYLGGLSIAGGKMKEAGTAHWQSPNTGADNSSGFTGLPAGHHDQNGNFYNFGTYGTWWASSTTDPWYRHLQFDAPVVGAYHNSKRHGFSVRCMRRSPCLDNPVQAQITALSDTVFCPGQSVELIAPGSLDFSYTWLRNGHQIDGATRSSYTVYNAGVYRVVITNSYGCTDTSREVYISTHTLPNTTVTVSGDTSFCVGRSVELSTNSIPGYSYRWLKDGNEIPGATGAVYTATESGVYRLVVKNVQLCEDSSRRIELKALRSPISQAGHDMSICEGSNVSIGFEAVDGVPPYTYSWSPSNYLSATDIASPLANPPATTTYVVRVTDSNGCSSTDTVTVHVYERPAPIIHGPTSVCPGTTATYRLGVNTSVITTWSVTGGNIISDPASSDSIIVDWLTSGTGILRVHARIESSGCTSDTTLSVEIHEVITPIITPNKSVPFCLGDSVTLDAGDGFVEYVWSTGERSRSIIVKEAGTYSVDVRDAAGCSSSSQPYIVSIYPTPAPLIAASVNGPYCLGDSVVLDAGTGYTDYLWSTGAKTRTLVVQQSGSYTVTVRNASGCTGTAPPFEVQFNSQPIPLLRASGDTEFCYGDSITLSLDAPYYAYRWSTGQLTPIITVVNSGIYYVSVTDSNGCVGISAPISVTVHPRPNSGIVGLRNVCLDAIATYEAAEMDARSYTWTTSGGIFLTAADQQRIIVRWSQTGSNTLSLTVTSREGCTSDTSITVRVLEALQPVVTAQGPTTICAGDSVILEAELGYAQYLWSTGDTTHSIVAYESDSYSVNVTDASGCSGISPPVVVTVLPLPDVLLSGPTSTCLDSDAGFSAISATGRNFSWSSTHGMITGGAGTAHVTIRWTRAGTDTVHVAVTNAEGCSRDTSLIVMINESLQPVIRTDRDPRICEGETVTLDAGGGYASYQWSSGETTRSIVVSTAGSYSVEVTDAMGCTGTSEPITVTVLPRPVPVITGTTTFCEGETGLLDAGEGYTSYVWATGETSRELVVTQAGSYRVTVTDANGCKGEAETMVTVHPRPVPTVSEQNSTLVSTPAASYRWQRDGADIPGAIARTFAPPDSGAYTVTVTNAFGCEGTSAPFLYVPLRGLARIGFACPSPASSSLPAGAIIVLPLRLESSSQLDAIAAHAFSARVRFDRTILVPQLFTTTSRFEDNERIITVSGLRAASMEAGVLLDLPFMAVLGDADCATVRIDSLWWDDANPRSDIAAAECEICVEVCREGGTRLVHATGRLSLGQNRPNPFNATTLIEYELIEDGYSELLVMDLMGRRVATLMSGRQMAGRYIVPFNASALSSGSYMYLLRTPSASLLKLMEVVK